jgi:hypothetical protein
MTTMTTVLIVRRERAGRKRLKEEVERELPTGENVPRIARLMALAIKFRGMLDDGTVKDISELARLARVSQPRMTQIMNLNFLAPDIQDRILSLSRSCHSIHLRDLQCASSTIDWTIQRHTIRQLLEV